MYFICKCWEHWILRDETSDQNRELKEQEMDRLRSTFPLLFGRQTRKLSALLITSVPMAKLPQFQRSTNLTGQSKKGGAGPQYLIFKVTNIWMISDWTKQVGRPMEDLEIDLVTTFFSSLIGQQAGPIEALSLSVISFSRLEQLADLPETPVTSQKGVKTTAKT